MNILYQEKLTGSSQVNVCNAMYRYFNTSDNNVIPCMGITIPLTRRRNFVFYSWKGRHMFHRDFDGTKVVQFLVFSSLTTLRWSSRGLHWSIRVLVVATPLIVVIIFVFVFALSFEGLEIFSVRASSAGSCCPRRDPYVEALYFRSIIPLCPFEWPIESMEFFKGWDMDIDK